ncbi:hypothetical protein PG994_013800 [Apiospora phragmitis]|uniref:SnoaL-like domain-containing protein n=1 Tax=Apiospora phragmitis TaxID=2905665 RepID=A0ABR1T2H7_9PEZI
MPRSRFSIYGEASVTTTVAPTAPAAPSSSLSSAHTATYSLFPIDTSTRRCWARPPPRARPRTRTKPKEPRPASVALPPRPASVSLPHIAMLLSKPLPDPSRKTAAAAANNNNNNNGKSSSPAPAPASAPTFANSDDMLRWLYADLTRISQVAAPDIILHRAEDHSNPLRGAAAAQEHEEGLVAAAGGTLAMNVDRVSSNEHFGSVMGTLRAQSQNMGVPDLAVPFCGVWRFEKGTLAEHWENVSVDPAKVARWFEEAARAKVVE